MYRVGWLVISVLVSRTLRTNVQYLRGNNNDAYDWRKPDATLHYEFQMNMESSDYFQRFARNKKLHCLLKYTNTRADETTRGRFIEEGGKVC